MQPGELSTALKKSILDSDLKDLLEEYAEMGIDTIIDDNVLSQIPIIKTLVGVYKLGVGIKERFITQKIIKFLTEVNNIQQSERDAFVRRLSEDERYSQSVMEKIILLLDRLDDVHKAKIIGELFKATITQQLTIDEFLKLSSMVERSYMADLNAFLAIENHADIDKKDEWMGLYWDDVKKNLSSIGLLSETIQMGLNYDSEKMRQTAANPNNVSFKYSLSYFGKLLIRFCEPYKRKT